MEKYKVNVKAMAANLNISVGELAKKAGINPNHLYEVSAGRSKMTADDLIKLSAATGVPAENIAIEGS